MKFGKKNRNMEEKIEIQDTESREQTGTVEEQNPQEPVTETANSQEVDPKVAELTLENEALKTEVEKLKGEIDSLRDILQRRMAEIDNIKRRHREE